MMLTRLAILGALATFAAGLTFHPALNQTKSDGQWQPVDLTPAHYIDCGPLNDVLSSSVPSATVEYSFNGTEVSLYFLYRGDGAEATVSIDGVVQGVTTALVPSAPQYCGRGFNLQGLDPDTEHTVVLSMDSGIELDLVNITVVSSGPFPSGIGLGNVTSISSVPAPTLAESAGGLSGAAIGGIVGAVLAAVLVFAGITIFFLRRRHMKAKAAAVPRRMHMRTLSQEQNNNSDRNSIAETLVDSQFEALPKEANYDHKETV